MARGRTNPGKGPGKAVKTHKNTAWLWAETTEPHKITQKNVETAYRVATVPCVRSACRINCKYNPNCVNGLGEKLWLGEVQDNYWHSLEDPETERRKQDDFVGLKNLGATCYVNTFLQLWFHNTSLRSAIYHWTNLDSNGQSISDDASQDGNDSIVMIDKNDSEKSSIGLNTLPPIMPSSCIGADSITNICAHLQVIFTQLQYSCRRYIDPTPLIHSLGLDTAQQQDAQEFSKLFMSLLESTLSAQSNSEVRDVIQKQFGGEYVYVTKCDKCGNKSMTLSQFFELDVNIQGHSSLSQCIKEFLKEEELNGDNQYFCMACNSKQNAKRYIEIQSLPPVLNLQLLRFVFDRKTRYKKKLNSHVQFPDVLNLNSTLKDDAKQGTDGPLYDLTAVLMHQGTSAYSGHYIAHIRDKKTDTWYKFNDEEIEKMQNKLKLSGEDETSEPGEKPAKRPKCTKGYHTSRNAYMLVYTRRTTDVIPEADVEVPEHLQELVAKDNSKFEEWFTAMNKMKNDMITRGKSLQASIQSVYEILPVKGRDYEWMSTEWLRTWLNDRVDVKPPIDNSSLLCIHGKLHPEKAQNAKRISIKAADLFFYQFGGLPRLQRDSLCSQCVRSMCSQIRFKAKLAEDDKAIKAILKNKPEPSSGKLFWIGKTSLQSWKKLATLEEEAKTPQVSHSPATKHQFNGSTINSKKEIENNRTSPDSRKRKSMSTTDEDGCSTPKDDESKSCQTPRLDNGCVEESSKDSPSQMDSSSFDDSSRLNDSDEDDDEELIKFNEDLLCNHDNLSPNVTCRKLIPESIWKRLTYYFGSAHQFPGNHRVCHQCQAENEDERQIHEMNRTQAAEERAALSNLHYNKHRPNLYDNEMKKTRLYVVSNSFLDKWRLFLRHCNRITRPESITNESLLCPHRKFMFNPELKGEDGAHEVYSYLFKDEWDTLAKIYSCEHVIAVTKETINDDDKSCRFVTTPEICQECHASRMLEKARSIENYRHATIYVRKITDEHDPQEIQRRFDEETLELDSPQDPDYSSSDSKKQKNNSDVSKRRSSRHRKQRGEVNLTVNSNQTLRDIKLELMKSFSVMPMDQHLSLKGTLLSDDAATLSRLGVRPGCLLMLKLDQPQGGSHPETFLAASTTPEKGFKGTGLLGH